VGCPNKIINITGWILNEGTIFNLLKVNHGTKQGCAMTPLLFSTVFSEMLHDAFKDCDKERKISCRLLHDLFYDDTCALMANSEEGAQGIVDDLAKSAVP